MKTLIKEVPAKEFTANIIHSDKGYCCRQEVTRTYNCQSKKYGEYNFSRSEFGKYVFPVRSCAENLCEGLAKVKIVKEHFNYALAEIIMKKRELPDDESLMDRIVNHEIGMFHTIDIRRNSKIGDYAVLHNLFGDRTIYQENGDWKSSEEGVNYDDGAKYAVTKDLSQFIAEVKAMPDPTSIFNSFVEFHFMPKDIYIIPSNRSIDDDIFDDALDYGIVEIREWKSLIYATLNREMFVRAYGDFDMDELQEVVNIASDLNRKANQTIIKSGVNISKF